MKYVSEFRDAAAARRVARAIAAEADPSRDYRIMEFCGGHTHGICRYGLSELVPRQVEYTHGPGCPVCVLPVGRLDQAIELALARGVILCAYGDMMRVPASRRLSLLKAKAAGADIRTVYGSADALAVARARPDREVVLLAIGFETTAPTTAAAILQADALGLANFSVLANHVLTPPAVAAILAGSPGDGEPIRVDGIIGPGHVSTITGTALYERLARDHRTPIVVAGFEPLDILQATLMLVRQLNGQRAEVENQYIRAVDRDGNVKAQRLVERVFERSARFDWRGLGTIPDSALAIRPAYGGYDAERRFDSRYRRVPDHPACACGEVLRGVKRPAECRIFATGCTPDHPVGACMVSPEGACAAHYQYGRARPGEAAE